MTPDDIGTVTKRLALDAANAERTLVMVRVDDLATLLHEFAQLRRRYDQRGEVIERILEVTRG